MDPERYFTISDRMLKSRSICATFCFFYNKPKHIVLFFLNLKTIAFVCSNIMVCT